MKNDSKSLWPAVVDVTKVKFSKEKDLGIDFRNEIDAWSKMEFKSRQQVQQLKSNTTLAREPKTLNDLKSLFYSVREKID